MTHTRPRLLLLVNDEKYFQVHRLDHARAARQAGMEVFVCTQLETDGTWIEQEGFQFLPSPFMRGMRHPFNDLSAALKVAYLYRRVKPDIVHHFAMKPILFGSWAARLTTVPAVVNTFAGLGFIFCSDGWRSRLLRPGLTVALRSALALPNSRVLFENADDRERLIRRRIVRRQESAVVGGTGVDIDRFAPAPEKHGVPIVLLASRMLWDKGVGDFVRAAQLLKERRVPGRFVLVGTPDPHNPASIPEAQLLAWQQQGLVEWWGYRDDMPEVLRSAHVVVLPTFYEGLPRILLEAAACGRPVVATTIPGCMEIVQDGENGLLVPPKDTDALVKAIATLLENQDLRMRMGQRGRMIVVRQFSIERVSDQVLSVYDDLLHSRRGWSDARSTA